MPAAAAPSADGPPPTDAGLPTDAGPPSRPTVALIIATYNRPAALDRVLASVLAQTSPPEQVLIADDGSTIETARIVARWQPRFGGRLVHVWQPDTGFRLSEARNRAARDATTDLLVFIDGDCLLRPTVIAEHRRLAEAGCAVAGNRLLLSPGLTEAIEAGRVDPVHWSMADWLKALKAGDVGRLSPLVTLPGHGWRKARPRHWLQFRGCNMAVWRHDFVTVNGFEERISGWGFEDSDLAIRLINAGVRIKSGRFATAVLHLWHRERPRDRAAENRQRALAAQRDRVVRAAQGLAERPPDDRHEAPRAATAPGPAEPEPAMPGTPRTPTLPGAPGSPAVPAVAEVVARAAGGQGGWAGRLALAAHVALGLYLASLLAVPRASSMLAGLTALLAIVAMLADAWASRRPGAAVVTGRLEPPPRPGAIGMTAFVLPALAWGLIVAGQILAGIAPPKYGNQVIAAFAMIAIAASRVPWRLPDVRRWLLPCAAAGAIGAVALALWQSRVEGIVRPYGWLGASELGTGAIKFGDLSAVLALLSLVLVLTARGWRHGLGLAGVAAGILSLSLSQARGGLVGTLLAVAMLALALGLARRGRRVDGVSLQAGPAAGGGPGRRRQTVGIVALAAAMLVASAVSMYDRFAVIDDQIATYQQGNAATETGQRLALWTAAVRSGLHAPLTGVGLGGFGADLDRQRAAGQIPASITILYRQPHNEYLAGFVAAGFPGLLAIVALFGWPVVTLVRRIARGADSPQARAALVTVAAFAGFALTDSMFDRQITVVAFFLLAGWLMRMADRPADAFDAAVAPVAPSLPPLGSGPRLSVAVIAKNESHRIVRCLQSVAFAEQIVVVDSGSEDDTVALARQCGATVLETRDWPGFGVQKNRALAACSAPWVLSIDADEEVSERLRASIEAVIDGRVPQPANGYWLVRSSRFCGQTMRFGNWRNDRVLRLFRRDLGRFSDDLVHERVICPAPLGELRGVLEHYSIDSIDDAREKTIRYARVGAVQLRQRGRGGIVSAWTHAGWSFIRGYLLRFGFLDGRNGLTLAWLSAQGTYWRYRWAKAGHPHE